MTKDQFQRETNDYMTRDEQEDRAKAAEYNERGVDGDTIVAAKFGDMWCVMLGDAFAFTRELGID
jgi:hypothetical protein